MNMKRFGKAIVCSTMSFLVSCASIVSESKYPVMVSSNPPGATVTIKDENGSQIIKTKTPTVVTLAAGDGYFDAEAYTFVFEKEGYDMSMHTMTANLDGWYFGNIIFGGLLGILVVDPATGAMWKLDSNVNGYLSRVSPDVSPAKITTSKAKTTKKVIKPRITKVTEKPKQVASKTIQPTDTQTSDEKLIKRLSLLKKLKKEGILTDKEYSTKRAEVIKSL